MKKSNKSFTVSMVILFAAVLAATLILLVHFKIGTSNNKNNDTSDVSAQMSEAPESFSSSDEKETEPPLIEQKTEEKTEEKTENDTTKSGSTAKSKTTAASSIAQPRSEVNFPSDTSSWELILVNATHRVGNVDSRLNLSYVAGSGERMDSRAAAAYEKMYSAAANDGIYLTPCSGYRSYSTQERLFNEFVNDYLSSGYSRAEAESKAATRRMPAGSSEHNLGICMDIICASSSANFQNTSEYAWLKKNADKYGFIERYPENKAGVTGVKFEPWHWRYVGAENAPSIKASGLCLEEYLGQT
jgi:D-alanyl-D-alanine carboxypeptidase